MSHQLDEAQVVGIARIRPITPEQGNDVVITLPTRACGTSNVICVDERPLSQAATVPVPVAITTTPFTAAFSSVPEEHDGATAFTLRLSFSEEPAGMSYKTVRDNLFSVTGGTIRRAGRVTAGKNQGARWPRV